MEVVTPVPLLCVPCPPSPDGPVSPELFPGWGWSFRVAGPIPGLYPFLKSHFLRIMPGVSPRTALGGSYNQGRALGFSLASVPLCPIWLRGCGWPWSSPSLSSKRSPWGRPPSPPALLPTGLNDGTNDFSQPIPEVRGAQEVRGQGQGRRGRPGALK